MPINKYFKGHGKEVMKNMKSQYGGEKAERVFYATANKKGEKPGGHGGGGHGGSTKKK